jgi:hypothetical protein
VIVVRTEVYCDAATLHGRCRNWFSGVLGDGAKKHTAQKHALSNGWTQAGPNTHFCPACSLLRVPQPEAQEDNIHQTRRD